MIEQISNKAGCFSPDEIRQEAVRARAFLLDHPAVGGDHFDYRLFWWSIQSVCKRGYSEDSKGMVTVHYDSPLAAKFKAEIEKEYEDDPEMLSKCPFMCSIYKTYEEVFGEPWVYDHVEYWWELSFIVYEGDVSRESKEWMDQQKWGAYAFEHGGALTFEKCLVDAAALVREHLGNFKEYDFETAEEKANHEGKMPFSFVPVPETHHNPLTGKDEKCSKMEDNPEWLDVHNGMTNRRWLAWFYKTDYCTKHWKDQFNKLLESGMPG